MWSKEERRKHIVMTTVTSNEELSGFSRARRRINILLLDRHLQGNSVGVSFPCLIKLLHVFIELGLPAGLSRFQTFALHLNPGEISPQELLP